MRNGLTARLGQGAHYAGLGEQGHADPNGLSVVS